MDNKRYREEDGQRDRQINHVLTTISRAFDECRRNFALSCWAKVSMKFPMDRPSTTNKRNKLVARRDAETTSRDASVCLHSFHTTDESVGQREKRWRTSYEGKRHRFRSNAVCTSSTGKRSFPRRYEIKGSRYCHLVLASPIVYSEYGFQRRIKVPNGALFAGFDADERIPDISDPRKLFFRNFQTIALLCFCRVI